MDLAFCCKEGRSCFRLRIVENVGGYAFFADLAVAHDDDPWRYLSYDVDVVRDEKERGVLLPVDVRNEF